MTDRPRLVLHVGAHKTGTSLVQKFLRKNPDFCRANGFVSISRSASSDLLGWGTKPAEDPTELAGHLAKTARDNPRKTVVLSNENALGRPFRNVAPGLYPDTRKAARGLRAAAEAFDLRVVFYVRPLADFVESYYLQTIHQGQHHDFATWWTEAAHASAISWEPVIKGLDRVIGRENVRIGDFAEIKAGQDAFLRGFLGRCGLSSAGEITYDDVHNPSISARGLDMALDVNELLISKAEQGMMRKFLQKHFSNQDFERARPMPADVRAELTARDSANIERRLREDAPVATVGVGDGAA